jgi:hypothetical protein
MTSKFRWISSCNQYVKVASSLKEVWYTSSWWKLFSVHNVEDVKKMVLSSQQSHGVENKRDIGANCRSLEDKAPFFF